MSATLVALEHPRFRQVQTQIFTRRLVADCMTHHCSMVETRSAKLDACCQYGCDTDVGERDAILAHADDIRPLLRQELREARWFDPEELADDDYPSGRVVRTEVVGQGCVFLAHDRRGCGIHRAALERGWSIRGVKPAVCRLYPLSYDGNTIVIAEEYPEYSCAHVEGPSLYRLTRDTLADLFGADLIQALDAAELRVLDRDRVLSAQPESALPGAASATSTSS